MVLSHKKLKQKLRSLAAESLVKAGSTGGGNDKEEDEDATLRELGSLKQELKARRSLRQRPRRKMKKCSEEEGAEEEGEGNGKKGGDDDDEEEEEEEKRRNERKEEKKRKKEEKKKRKEMERLGKEKRQEEGGLENGECRKESRGEEEKRCKKEGKKRKKKESDSGCESGGGGGGDEEKLVEPLKFDLRDENSDFAKKVYVGGIPYHSTKDDIRSFFESCDSIIEVDCMTFPESGKFRGIAILTFQTTIAAEKALALDGSVMGNLFLKIQPYKSTRPAANSEKLDFTPEVVEGYNRIYAGNLSWDITEDDLRNLFADCKISSIRFGEDKETGDFKGYAHVDFADNVSHAIALKLDQQVVCGRPVRIRCAVPLRKDQGENGFKGKVNSENKFKSNEDEASVDLKSESTIIENSVSSGKKKKRRTCYECGVPGHLASACPHKKTAGAASSSVHN